MREATVLGIEIGGTKLQVAVGNAEGEIHLLEQGRVAPSEGAAGILSWLEGSVQDLLEQAANKGYPPPTKAGIGFGGPVESATGKVLTSHQIDGWKDVELRAWFEAAFPGVTAGVYNDSNAAGWAEYKRGAGQGCQNFAYMNIGSGIGGALVLNGRLYDGQGRGAGEMGHTYVADWTAATPGAVDKLELLCSGWSIERRLRGPGFVPKDSLLWKWCEGQPEKLRCAQLAQAAQGQDPFALAELDRVAAALGIAVSNLFTLFHPQRLALGGGVALMGDPLLEPLRRHVAQRVFSPFAERYEIVPCQLEESVVVVGALLLSGCR
jgi:glucokinase